jgi:hypothetical protein
MWTGAHRKAVTRNFTEFRIGTKGGHFLIFACFRSGIFSGDHFTPVGTDGDNATLGELDHL